MQINYNFVASLIKEKNNQIKENILLGNIHFPEKIIYTPQSLFQTENHSIFLQNLSNKLTLERIKEEKNFLKKKIENTNNKINNIRNYINKETLKNNNNKNKLPPLNTSKVLPVIKEKEEINKKSKEKFNKNKLLIEIKPLPTKRGNQVLIDKGINKEKEYDLEQNAKEFIRKINNYKINNITLKRQKQKKDLLRLKQEIEIAERRKQKEEYELLKKREEMKQNYLQRHYMNNYENNPQKIKKVKYHYYNPYNSAKKNRKNMMKNFSYVLNNNEYNYQNYNNNGYNYNIYPNINPYQQMNIEKERRNTENPVTLNVENNNPMYKDSNNHSLINESRSNNNSILNTSEKKAQDNKAGLKRQYVNIPIGDEEYGFRISGIGEKSVKIEKFIKYEDIYEAIESGNDTGLEAMIKQIIEDYEEEDEE